MALKNLKKLRQFCGLTQFELAAASFIPMHKISGAETGGYVLTDREAERIWEQLRGRWEWLRGASPEGAEDLIAEILQLRSGKF